MIVMPMLDIWDKLRFGMSLIVADGHLRNEAVDVLCRTDGDSL